MTPRVRSGKSWANCIAAAPPIEWPSTRALAAPRWSRSEARPRAKLAMRRSSHGRGALPPKAGRVGVVRAGPGREAGQAQGAHGRGVAAAEAGRLGVEAREAELGGHAGAPPPVDAAPGHEPVHVEGPGRRVEVVRHRVAPAPAFDD